MKTLRYNHHDLYSTYTGGKQVKKGTVWIIGGSSGLGLATATAFAADDWLVISGARSFGEPKRKSRIRRTASGCNGRRQPRSVCRRSVHAQPAAWMCLVYCAAILLLSPCELTSYDDYSRVMQTNFLGMTAFVSLVMPKMRTQQSGKIVLFSSLNGLFGIPFQSAYVASKHAVEGYAECLAMECKRDGRPGIADRTR